MNVQTSLAVRNLTKVFGNGDSFCKTPASIHPGTIRRCSPIAPEDGHPCSPQGGGDHAQCVRFKLPPRPAMFFCNGGVRNQTLDDKR